MRTASCVLITTKKCLEVVAITLTLSPIYRVAFNGRADGWRARQFDVFARFDGFRDWPELVEFWLEENGAIDRFDGYHIRWQALPAELRA